ncbi:MAG: alpha/beta fold hydrolase [Chloroflexi bacterium]|nr:alpha/beta fold hydrolase [Chloroflexota bacterium]
MTVQPSLFAWTRHYFYRDEGEVPGTQIAYYRLSDLISGGFVTASEGRGLLLTSGLLDLTWQVMWADSDPTPDEELEERIGNVQGYAIFMHGWTGNHAIWESIPGLVVTVNRRLVAISLDHNGFGDSRFAETPQLESCNPPADMRAVEALIDLLKIRRQPGQPNLKVINFVGHSMGGAALFYLNPINWRVGEETRLALAPALLLDDEVKRLFYTALGIGIGLVNRIHVFEVIERAIKPQVLDALTAGASGYVRQLHADQYQKTPRGTTATTFMAMGLLNNREIPRNWDAFRVVLGHRDPLVGLVPMMDMLSKLEFPAANTRVVAGTHYFFSVGPEAVFQHAQNRELVVQDILELHERAYALQRTGFRVG